MKKIKEYLNEAKEVMYRVAFLQPKDEEELPFAVTILVDPKNAKAFEKFLTDEQDNIFAHAEGGNLEEY